MKHQERILRLIAEVMDNGKTVTPQKLLVDELGFDSIQLTELVGAIEDEFDLLITLDRVCSIRTVQDLLDAVGRELAARPQPALSAEACDGNGR